MAFSDVDEDGRVDGDPTRPLDHAGRLLDPLVGDPAHVLPSDAPWASLECAATSSAVNPRAVSDSTIASHSDELVIAFAFGQARLDPRPSDSPHSTLGGVAE